MGRVFARRLVAVLVLLVVVMAIAVAGSGSVAGSAYPALVSPIVR
jgi:hypothetical protein